jgi:hypothetical protein
MDPIGPIAPGGPPAVPRRGLPPIDRLERVSRERDRPERDAQRRDRSEQERQEQRKQPKPEDAVGEQHRHVDVRA